MNNTHNTIAAVIVGIMLGFGLGAMSLGMVSGVDKDTTYVCAPYVSGERVGQTIIVDGVTHNCKGV